MKAHLSQKRIITLILALCLVLVSLTSCDIKSQHLEVTYEENSNESIVDWNDISSNNVTSWDDALIVTWNDKDD